MRRELSYPLFEMIRTRIKICGNTRVEDAVMAARAGADAIGVINVANTTRYISLDEAKIIFRSLPPFVSKVVVVTLDGMSEEAVAERIELIEATGADCVQLHGAEPVELVAEIRKMVKKRITIIKKIGVGSGSNNDKRECLEHAIAYENVVDAILLDTALGGGSQIGGTGKKHDWSISRAIVEQLNKPVILAGGLNPDNVADAIAMVKPYAVDVSSGVERELRIKDEDRVKRFIEAANSIHPHL